MADAPRAASLAVPALHTPRLRLDVLPPATRWSLHCAPRDTPAFASAFGTPIPTRALTASRNGSRAALWLGPDEWRLLAEADAVLSWPELAAASVVEISHAYVALALSGDEAADLLNEGCPLDLSDAAFALNACTRTLFGKCEIVLWRDASAGHFRIEVHRSYARHLWTCLTQAYGC